MSKKQMTPSELEQLKEIEKAIDFSKEVIYFYKEKNYGKCVASMEAMLKADPKESLEQIAHPKFLEFIKQTLPTLRTQEPNEITKMIMLGYVRELKKFEDERLKIILSSEKYDTTKNIQDLRELFYTAGYKSAEDAQLAGLNREESPYDPYEEISNECGY